MVCISASPQHPTQAVLDPRRRRRLLALSRSRGFRILEGDPGLGFHREQNPSLPLASEDPEGRVSTSAAWSRSWPPVSPVGFLAGQADLVKALARQRQLVDWPGNQVQGGGHRGFLRDGEFVRHLRRLRKVVEERRETMVDRLLLHLHPAIQVRDPGEGLSLWVRVAPDVPVAQWTARCAARGVVFYPGCLYDFDRQDIPFICIGFAAHNLDEQNEACARMAEALREIQPPLRKKG